MTYDVNVSELAAGMNDSIMRFVIHLLAAGFFR